MLKIKRLSAATRFDFDASHPMQPHAPPAPPPKRCRSSSGHCGVYWVQARRHWSVMTVAPAAGRFVGRFVTLHQALDAQRRAMRRADITPAVDIRCFVTASGFGLPPAARPCPTAPAARPC
jgi:hypothetical protein